MYKKIEKRILDFAKDTGLTERREIVHGTLYVKLHEEKECDHFHKVMRTFYKSSINPSGGVNMYSVGDEFAFDFVPSDDESPVFSDKDYSGKEGMMPDDIDHGVWSEFAEEGLMEMEPLDSQVDTLLELENEMSRGK